jgi:hypothetical protein
VLRSGCATGSMVRSFPGTGRPRGTLLKTSALLKVDILGGSEQDDIRIMEMCVRICNSKYFLMYALHYIYYDGYTILTKETKAEVCTTRYLYPNK